MPRETFPTLKRPPIHEAVLDARVRSRADLKGSDLLELRDVLRGELPQFEEMHAMEARIHFDASGTKAEGTGARQIGVLLKSADGKLVLQARVDGITLSRLAPYETFDALEPVLAKCWHAYVGITRPAHTSRVAVRYINRVDVPDPDDLGEVLVRPPVPTVNNVSVSAFVHQDLWRTENDLFVARVLTALEPGINGRTAQVIVDIDAFSERHQIAIASRRPGESFRELQELFSELRMLKNRIFFSLLTQQCIQTFQ